MALLGGKEGRTRMAQRLWRNGNALFITLRACANARRRLCLCAPALPLASSAYARRIALLRIAPAHMWRSVEQ